MLCASCFTSLTAPKKKPKRDWFLLTTSLQLGIGLIIIWMTIFLVGRILLSIPESFHEGSVWEALGNR